MSGALRQPVFRTGDKVRVRPEEVIAKTLDPMNMRDGCLFMDRMLDYCNPDQHFKVLKVVRNFFDENRFKMHKTRSPAYLLEKVICDGAIEGIPQQCDRSCYFLWHEDWLEKAG